LGREDAQQTELVQAGQCRQLVERDVARIARVDVVLHQAHHLLMSAAPAVARVETIQAQQLCHPAAGAVSRPRHVEAGANPRLAPLSTSNTSRPTRGWRNTLIGAGTPSLACHRARKSGLSASR